jgi:hypothetical protein
MDRKYKPFIGGTIRWNPADPSGYGVPGKPITLDQFFTEDVFRMLVPDDGLGPAEPATTLTQAEGPPPAPRPPALGLQGRDRQIRAGTDPNMERRPMYGNDMEIVKNPDSYSPGSPPGCSDETSRFKAVNTYRTTLQQLEDARSDLAAVSTPQQRDIAQQNIAMVERGLEQARPAYEQAVKCARRT